MSLTEGDSSKTEGVTFVMGAVLVVLSILVIRRVTELRVALTLRGVVPYSLLFTFLFISKLLFLPPSPPSEENRIRGNRDVKMGAYGGKRKGGRFTLTALRVTLNFYTPLNCVIASSEAWGHTRIVGAS